MWFPENRSSISLIVTIWILAHQNIFVYNIIIMVIPLSGNETEEVSQTTEVRIVNSNVCMMVHEII